MCRGVAGRGCHPSKLSQAGPFTPFALSSQPGLQYNTRSFVSCTAHLSAASQRLLRKGMTYQVLARKWRPKNFHEMAGQAHVLQTLTHALEQQRLHHAYLFTGTRGVGKTTVARILARCFNCEEGVTATRCGTGSACQEIGQGGFLDRIEVDAASRPRVGEI